VASKAVFRCEAGLIVWSLGEFLARNRMDRFSVLPYANALPLVHFIQQVCPGAELVYRIPRRALDALLTGGVDAALVPIIDHLGHPDTRMIEGLGICADGDVASVLLQCRRPLREVRTVQPDPESKTSNVLVQVLLRHHFRIDAVVACLPDGAVADARVCIGDRALRSHPSLETYDLAGEWKRMTGLPFVFAAWVVCRSCPNVAEISSTLRSAKDIGCRSIGMLAQLAAERLNLPEDRCRDYLGHCLHYDVGTREHQAIDLFRRLAAEIFGPDTGKALHPAASGVRS
jgi:chorismate dehydratase